MSTQVNTYVMYGCLLDYAETKARHEGGVWDKIEPYTDNAFKPEVNPKDGLTVLYDGMDGRYIAIGHVIAKTDNHQSLKKPVEIPTEDTMHPVRVALFALMKELKVADKYAPRWLVVSHYR